MSGEDHEELRRVMREVTEAMGGQATAISLHPDDPEPPTILFCEDSCGLTPCKVLATLPRLAARMRRGRSDHQWIDAPAEGFSDALSISVERVPGGSRVVLNVFFDNLTADQRHRAENAYLTRGPFAVGYFRLWQLNRRNCRQAEALQAAFDLSEPGAILLNKYGTPLHANRRAEALLDAAEGIQRINGGVAGTQRKEALMLRAAVDHAILANDHSRTQHPPIIQLSRATAPPLLVSVLPPPRPPADPHDVAAIICLHDPTIDKDQLFSQLRQLYDLTPVEARLTSLLVDGLALAEAAAAMHLKEQSARSCLKQVFLKTQTRRQGDLIRLVFSNLLRTTRYR
jgi:DNA-binding CsgD family transcriptional regulator/PAS domain-containing protein